MPEPRQLERFREILVEIFGEDPCVLMAGSMEHPGEDLLEVSLADYLGWFMKADHAAVYRWEGETFRRLAAFGRPSPESISPESPLPQWLLEHGPLVRSRLTLTDLSAAEAETLLQDLDHLGASLVVPVPVNEGLWGFLTVGSSPIGEYNAGEPLYLNLYGLEMIRCLDRRRHGFPSRSTAQALEESRVLREIQELWLSFKPRQNRVKLLILEEESETTGALSRFFSGWGFEVAGAGSEEAAIAELKRLRPHLILSDIQLQRRLPVKLLRAAQAIVPEAIVAGTASVRHEPTWERAREFGVQQIFYKPCRFARLARWLFEAAMSVSVRTEGEPLPRPESCLIVDDQIEATEAMQGYFETKGYRVWSAPSEVEALPLAERARPDFILLDLKFPAGGAKLLGRIRQASPQSRVVVLSAAGQEDPDLLFKSDHPDAYCLKPVPLREIERIVETLPLRSAP